MCCSSVRELKLIFCRPSPRSQQDFNPILHRHIHFASSHHVVTLLSHNCHHHRRRHSRHHHHRCGVFNLPYFEIEEGVRHMGEDEAAAEENGTGKPNEVRVNDVEMWVRPLQVGRARKRNTDLKKKRHSKTGLALND